MIDYINNSIPKWVKFLIVFPVTIILSFLYRIIADYLNNKIKEKCKEKEKEKENENENRNKEEQLIGKKESNEVNKENEGKIEPSN